VTRALNSWLAAAALAVVAAIGYTAPGAGQPAPSGCAVGQSRIIDPQQFVRQVDSPATTPLVIGCSQTRRGQPFEVLAYRNAGSALCAYWKLPATAARRHCGAPDERFHGLGSVARRTTESGGVVTAFVSPWVSRAQLRYRIYGEVRRSRAWVLRVRDVMVLARLQLRKAFAFMTAEVPAPAKHLSIALRDRTGKLISRIPLGTDL
jgi:hypothetical protein